MSGTQDADESQRRHEAPFSNSRPVPTIQRYRAEQQVREANAAKHELHYTSLNETDPNDETDASQNNHINDETRLPDPNATGDETSANDSGADLNDGVDTSEDAVGSQDLKERRKNLARRSEGAEREVTDPVTHLPVKISDFTQHALKEIEENPPSFGSTLRTATGLSNKQKSYEQLQKEIREMQDGLDSMNMLFPPPNYEEFRIQVIDVLKRAMTVGLLGCALIVVLVLLLERSVLVSADSASFLRASIWLGLGAGSGVALLCLISALRAWMANRVRDLWASNIWEANRQSTIRDAKARETESVAWLNSLISSVWPLINPDLFTSVADMLEDVMQASLPGIIQMVGVEDIGQGSEALRILGIRWLPSGAAARSVGSDGKLESADNKKHAAKSADSSSSEGNQKSTSGEMVPAEADEATGEDASQAQASGGMEAEEGDFINLEVSFAYRARPPTSLQDRSKDVHMVLAFYLPGNIKIPIWVDVRGIVGLARLRLQLTPDPPFFALCTLTCLGQPKVDISCIPLIKYGPNIMDLPLIKNFVQTSIDAAMAEYVAPKSLTLDLKDMLAGDDFKKDTTARGILVVNIHSGYDFRCGDAAIPLIRKAGADPYCSVGWAKFGKPLWSTRVLKKEMNPIWHERCYLLVTPAELDVDERLRIQLWDSDRFTADDDLGRIEVDIKSIMRSDESNGKMHDREDGFRALKAGEEMPGKLRWSVGYFSKTRLQRCQYEVQDFDKEIRSKEQLEEKVERISKRKLREAQIKKGRHAKTDEELQQMRAQELKDFENSMTISAPPPDGFPSGVLSIQIHQITGLELTNIGQSHVDATAADREEKEDGDDLPSAYCNIIINHNKVYKTRSKPKNARPFFNAGTERFIADWRTAEVFVSVRDQRVGEDDPLLGIVHLPLASVFAKRSQSNEYYPLVGGVGYGRVRISLVWRSVQLTEPETRLGWDYGTLEIQPNISTADVPEKLRAMDIKMYTNLSSGKMRPDAGSSTWKTRRGDSLKLAVRQRYSSCLAIRIKHKTLGKDATQAFAILWLKDIVDEQEQEITLPMWTGDYERAKACTLEDCGEKIGSIKLTIKYWSGLGGSHGPWARKDPNLRNVMEVLEVAQDHLDDQAAEREAGIVGVEPDSSSDESSSDSSESDEDEKERDEKSGESNGLTVVDKVRDYKKNSRQKSRQHRGVMQYKAPRTAQWALNKVGRVEDKIGGIFRRHTREPGIETEA